MRTRTYEQTMETGLASPLVVNKVSDIFLTQKNVQTSRFSLTEFGVLCFRRNTQPNANEAMYRCASKYNMGMGMEGAAKLQDDQTFLDAGDGIIITMSTDSNSEEDRENLDRFSTILNELSPVEIFEPES